MRLLTTQKHQSFIRFAVRLIKIHGASGAVSAFKAEFDNSKVELQWFIDTHTAVATQRGINNTNSKLDKYLTKMETQSETMKTLSENVRKGRDQFDKMQYVQNPTRHGRVYLAHCARFFV